MCPHIHPMWHRRFTKVSPVPSTFSFFLSSFCSSTSLVSVSLICVWGREATGSSLKWKLGSLQFISEHLLGPSGKRGGYIWGYRRRLLWARVSAWHRRRLSPGLQAVLQGKKLDKMSLGLSKPRAYSFHAWYPLKMAFCSGRPIWCPGQSMSRWWRFFFFPIAGTFWPER